MWFLAWLWLSFPAPAEGPYPAYLHGKDGFRYRLQLQRGSEAVEGEDGRIYFHSPALGPGNSPLYVGRKSTSGPEIKVTLHQLYRDSLLDFLPEKPVEHRSRKIPEAFQIRLHPGLLLGILNTLQQNPQYLEDFTSQASPSKTSFIQKFLFEDEFVLYDSDLRELRRSDRHTDPGPLEFQIPISVPIKNEVEIPLHPWAENALEALAEVTSNSIDAFWSMSVGIQVERLAFHFREKRLFFDPKEQQIMIQLVADRAQVSGPLHEIGETKRLFNWRPYDEHYRLENGEIGEMTLQMSLAFRRESPDLWALSVKPSDFKLEFSQTPTEVNLHVTGTSSKGVVRDEHQPVKMESSQQVNVLGILSTTTAQALASRFFSDTVSLKYSKKPLLPDAEPVSFQGWVNRIQFRREGIDLLFDAQYELAKVDECLGPVDPQDRKKFLESLGGDFYDKDFSFSPLETTQNESWGLQWSRDTRHWVLVTKTGEALQPVVEAPAEISLAHHPEFLNWMLYSAWLAGEMCVDSKLWWPRPAHMPLMKALLTQAPRMRVEEEDIVLELDGKFLTLERRTTDKEDRFDRVTIDKNFKGAVRIGRMTSDLKWEEFVLEFDNLTDQENEFIRRFAKHILEKVEFLRRFEGESTQTKTFSLRRWAENLGQGDIQFSNFQWDDQSWFTKIEVKDFTGLFERKPRLPRESPPRYALRTVLTQRPEYWVQEPILRLEWRQEDKSLSEGEVFYSWRLQRLGDFSEEESWSQFDSKNKAQLILEEEGLYRFEVRAMDRNYEIEFPTAASADFYFLGVREPNGAAEESLDEEMELGRDEPEEDTPNSEEPAKRSPGESQQNSPPRAQRMNAKGPFGCSLHSDGSASPWEALWLFIAGASLVVIRRAYKLKTN